MKRGHRHNLWHTEAWLRLEVNRTGFANGTAGPPGGPLSTRSPATISQRPDAGWGHRSAAL